MYSKIKVLCILLCIFLLTGCSVKNDTEKTNNKKTDFKNLDEQIDWLFEYVGLSSSHYEITKEDKSVENLIQKWYQSKNDKSSGAYIAVGDIKANKSNGFPEIGNNIQVLNKDDDYILEITIGNISDDGYMEMNAGTRSYYFVQEGKDIIFKSMERY